MTEGFKLNKDQLTPRAYDYLSSADADHTDHPDRCMIEGDDFLTRDEIDAKWGDLTTMNRQLLEFGFWADEKTWQIENKRNYDFRIALNMLPVTPGPEDLFFDQNSQIRTGVDPEVQTYFQSRPDYGFVINPNYQARAQGAHILPEGISETPSPRFLIGVFADIALSDTAAILDLRTDAPTFELLGEVVPILNEIGATDKLRPIPVTGHPYIQDDFIPLSDNTLGIAPAVPLERLASYLSEMEDVYVSANKARYAITMPNQRVQDQEYKHMGTGLALLDESAKNFRLATQKVLVGYGLPARYVPMKSFVEGGNVVVHRDKKGEIQCYVGIDTLLLSALPYLHDPEQARVDMAEDFGLRPEQVRTLPQFDYHIDLRVRPLDNGRLFLSSPLLALEKLNEIIASLPHADKKTQDYLVLKARFETALATPNGQILLREIEGVRAQLEADGYEVIDFPDYYLGVHNFHPHTIGITHMNNRYFTDKSGEVHSFMFASGYDEIDAMIREFEKDYGIDHSHFLLKSHASPEEFGNTYVRDTNAGFGCLTSI